MPSWTQPILAILAILAILGVLGEIFKMSTTPTHEYNKTSFMGMKLGFGSLFVLIALVFLFHL